MSLASGNERSSPSFISISSYIVRIKKVSILLQILSGLLRAYDPVCLAEHEYTGQHCLCAFDEDDFKIATLADRCQLYSIFKLYYPAFILK